MMLMLMLLLLLLFIVVVGHFIVSQHGRHKGGKPHPPASIDGAAAIAGFDLAATAPAAVTTAGSLCCCSFTAAGGTFGRRIPAVPNIATAAASTAPNAAAMGFEYVAMGSLCSIVSAAASATDDDTADDKDGSIATYQCICLCPGHPLLLVAPREKGRFLATAAAVPGALHRQGGPEQLVLPLAVLAAAAAVSHSTLLSSPADN